MVKSCEQLGSYLSHSLVVFRTGTIKTSYFTFFHFDKLYNLSLKKQKELSCQIPIQAFLAPL